MIQISSLILFLLIIQIISGEVYFFPSSTYYATISFVDSLNIILGLVSMQFSLWNKSQVTNE